MTYKKRIKGRAKARIEAEIPVIQNDHEIESLPDLDATKHKADRKNTSDSSTSLSWNIPNQQGWEFKKKKNRSNESFLFSRNKGLNC